MFVLSRKVGEIIMIGDDIRIKLVGVRGRRAIIGVEAPLTKRIDRPETKKNFPPTELENQKRGT